MANRKKLTPTQVWLISAGFSLILAEVFIGLTNTTRIHQDILMSELLLRVGFLVSAMFISILFTNLYKHATENELKRDAMIVESSPIIKDELTDPKYRRIKVLLFYGSLAIILIITSTVAIHSSDKVYTQFDKAIHQNLPIIKSLINLRNEVIEDLMEAEIRQNPDESASLIIDQQEDRNAPPAERQNTEKTFNSYSSLVKQYFLNKTSRLQDISDKLNQFKDKTNKVQADGIKLDYLEAALAATLLIDDIDSAIKNEYEELHSLHSQIVDLASDQKFILIFLNILTILIAIIGSFFLSRHHKHLEFLVKERTRALSDSLIELKSSAQQTATAYSLVNATLEASSNGILVVDLNGKVILRNRRFLEMWDIEADHEDCLDDKKIMAVMSRKILHPNEFLTKIQKLYATPSATSEDTIELIDGRVFRRFSHPEKMDSIIIGRVWSFLDITEQYTYQQNEIQLMFAASEALKKSEQERNLLNSLLIAIPDLVWAKNTEGVFLVCNPAFCELMGTSPTQLIGKTDYDFFPKEIADAFLLEDKAAENSDGPISFEEWVTYNSDGHRSLLETIKVKIPGENGSCQGVVGIARDITKLRELMNDIKSARLEALQASEAKSLFLANMSHEIRTPMNAIFGLTELCLTTSLNNQQVNYLTKIQQASESLLYLINDILDLSKIEAGKLTIENISFVLESVFDQLSSVLSLRAEKQGVELSYDIEDEGNIFLGDPLRLAQILINLVGNAIKFSAGGNVIVSVKPLRSGPTQMELLFSIQDEGIGMTPEQIESLFQPFTQVDPSTTRKFGGTGLGLAISHRLVELMGGRIWVESALDKGSTFYFTYLAQIIEKDHRYNFELLAGQSHRPILVIDDCRVTLAIMNNLFSKLGFQTHCVLNAAAALEFIHTSETADYLACFVDWHMPEVDGIETIKQLRKTLTQKGLIHLPPMILVTQFSHQNDLGQHIDDLDGLLPKPVILGHLYYELARCMGIMDKSSSKVDQRVLTATEWSRFSDLDILLVEDITVNQEIIIELFSLVGLSVRLAANGAQAVNEVAKKRPDLILMDCQMPVMDGYEATIALRKMYPLDELPIIALTASALDADITKCFASGMNAHCAKPIRMSCLYERMLECFPDTIPLKQKFTQSNLVSDISPIPQFPGIDATVGLVNVGGRLPLFLRVLKQFRDNQGQHFERQFNEAFVESDWGKVKRLAHSLKGVSLTLGAYELGEICTSLLEAIEERNQESTLEKFKSASQLLRHIVHGLADIDTIVNDSNSESVLSTHLSADIEKLIHMLRTRDTAAVEFAQDISKNFTAKAVYETWKDAVLALECYDYKSALNSLENMLKSMK